MWVKINIILQSGKEITVYHKTELINSNEIALEFLGKEITPSTYSSTRFSKYSYGLIKASEIASLEVSIERKYNECDLY